MAKTLGASPESLCTNSTPLFFRLATMPEASVTSADAILPRDLPDSNRGQAKLPPSAWPAAPPAAPASELLSPARSPDAWAEASPGPPATSPVAGERRFISEPQASSSSPQETMRIRYF